MKAGTVIAEKTVCIVCGARFEEGRGFVEPHLGLCANKRYNWNFTRDVPDDWQRPVEIFPIQAMREAHEQRFPV